MITPPPADRYFSRGDVWLHYVDWGGDGRPLVLLHGLQDTARNWDGIAAALCTSHHVYALDARGHGDSQWTPGRYQFQEHAQDVAALLEELGVRGAVLVGHSAGGKYAFTQAANDPSRLAGLVIVDMDPDAVNPGSSSMFDRYRSEGDEWPDLEAVVERLRSRGPDASDATLQRLAQAMTRPSGDGGLRWKRDRRVVTEYERPDAWEALARISVPALIVRGAGSTLLRGDVARRMVASIPDAHLVEVPGRHWCIDENPEAFLSALGCFLERIG